MTEHITTGAAAKLLGTSRQHVVDLVDRGTLRNFGTNVHRRLDREEVAALVGTRATRDDRQSLWLHTAVAGQVVRSPATAIQRAKRNLARIERAHGRATVWTRRWRGLLESGPESVVRALVADTPESRELRQNSPFAGVLTERERLRTLLAFREAERRAR